MPTELGEMNFELLPSPGAASGTTFGIYHPISIDDGGFDPGEDSWTAEDDANPILGGTAFGRDTLDGPTWTFSLHADTSNAIEARAAISEFKKSWRASSIRKTPGAMTCLRYRLAGEVRRVYGRPRRFAAPPDNRIMGGYVSITADFACVDGYVYSDVMDSSTIQMSMSPLVGGFIFPTQFPLTTIPVGNTQGALTVGGEEPAAPIVTFTGPLTNPVLTHPKWTLALTMGIPAGVSVVVDTRPWAMTVLDSSGVSAIYALGRHQSLADIRLEPGNHQLTLTASVSSGAGRCEVRWANTWNSI